MPAAITEGARRHSPVVNVANFVKDLDDVMHATSSLLHSAPYFNHCPRDRGRPGRRSSDRNHRPRFESSPGETRTTPPITAPAAGPSRPGQAVTAIIAPAAGGIEAKRNPDCNHCPRGGGRRGERRQVTTPPRLPAARQAGQFHLSDLATGSIGWQHGL